MIPDIKQIPSSGTLPRHLSFIRDESSSVRTPSSSAGFAISEGEIPAFISSIDTFLEKARLEYDGDVVDPTCLVFASQRCLVDGVPMFYSRTVGLNDEKHVVGTLQECFQMSPFAYRMVTKAWMSHYIEMSKDCQDKRVKILRRLLLSFENRSEDGSDNRTAIEEARLVADRVAYEHPDRTDQINILQAESRQYRRNRLTDISLCIDQIIADIRLQMAQDEQHIRQTQADAEAIAANLELDTEYRRQQLAEARRVKEVRLADRLDEAEILHDYEHAIHCAQTRREFIARMTAEAEQFEAEADRIAQQYQPFDVKAAAKNHHT